jgi:hypothetical protein
MPNPIISHVRSNVVAYLALFAALGGTSYAAVQLAPGSVTTTALANGAVTRGKLAAHSVGERNLLKRSLTAADFKPGVLRSVLRATPRRGPAGRTGATGVGGPVGPPGHDGNASVVLRARGTGDVTAAHGSGTTIPLTGTTWSQGANDLNLITGAVTMQTPSSCTGSFGNAVVISVDGVPNTFLVAPTAPANAKVTVPMVVSELTEPGADGQHTITAKLNNTCTKSGEDFKVTDAKIDVVAFR